MKNKIQVYKQEKLDGLHDKIRSQNTLSYAALIQSQNKTANLKLVTDNIYNKIIASKDPQPDLYYLRTILVSVGWNANDDVFGKEIVWAARHTPEDKPFNFEHNSKDIIGHMTSAYAVDEKYDLIDDDTPEDEIPDQFHILTGAVLYKAYQESKEDIERMEKIIAEIEEGKWFVSMEAIFTSFDYALQDKTTGESKIVSRNKDTAFLTKYLRSYGGNGEYQNYKIGRYLKNIVFCGKGLVRNPANKDSVIILDTHKFVDAPIVAKLIEREEKEKNVKILEKNEKIEINKENTVYIVADTNTNKGNQNIMNPEFEKLQAELKAATASLSLVTNERDAAKAEVTKLTESNKTLSTELDKLKADNILLAERATKAEASVETLKKDNEKMTVDLAKIEAEKVTANRINVIMEKGTSEDKAKEIVNLLAKLNDEEFTKFAASHTVAKETKETPKLTAEELLKISTDKAAASQQAMAIASPSVNDYDKGVNDLIQKLINRS